MYSQMGEGNGGGETVFRQVADGLERRGHEVFRVFSDPEVLPGKQEREKKKWRMGLSTPSQWRGILQYNDAVGFIKSLIGLADFVRSVEPDVVNFHYFTAEALHFALLKTILRYRLVVTCHGSDVLNLHKTPIQEKVAPFVLAQADRVTCVSQALVEKLQKKVSRPLSTRVIHNGIDPSFWHKNGDTKGERQEEHLVSVGALRDVKGHDVLLRAFEQVAERHPEVTLQIVGDGPNRNLYESMIADAGLTDRVSISGWRSRKGVREALHEASIFVFPSRHEGFGLALVEAMAAGCPVVASDVGGISEITLDTLARLVPSEDPDALAEVIVESLADLCWQKEAAMASKQRASQFDWKRVIDTYEQCLRGA